jgi:hypothetical protein
MDDPEKATNAVETHMGGISPSFSSSSSLIEQLN